MNTKKIILTTIACVMYIIINAQEEQEYLNISLESVNTIVIDKLSGNTTLIKSETDEISIKSELYKTGNSWGWRSPENRPSFKSETRLSNDTLYIKVPNTFHFKTVGISTYKEHISNVIQIPEKKNVVINQANKLCLETDFASLKIMTAKEIDCSNLKKAQLKSLVIHAKQLLINGNEHNQSFEFQSMGLAHYFFNANKVSIIIK